jgi:dephospho-CoA kinase
MNTSAKNIVGVGGLPRSGKDSLAEFFMERGFYGVSFGDIIRDFAFKRHADKPDPISVKNMTETSNWLRAERGADAVLSIALELYAEAQKSKDYKGVVLFSVRAPVEVDYILEKKGSLVWVEASDENRHTRAIENLRKGEAEISIEEFKAQEALQWEPQPGIPEEVQMNIQYVKEKATVIFENNQRLQDFNLKAQRLVDSLS